MTAEPKSNRQGVGASGFWPWFHSFPASWRLVGVFEPIYLRTRAVGSRALRVALRCACTLSERFVIDFGSERS